MAQLISSSDRATMRGLRRGVVTLVCLLMLMTGSALPSCATPPVASPGLPRSSPEAQGIASSDILAFLQAADEQIDTMNSFMLVRHGHVVSEGWWSPFDAETPHVLFSLSKSFTSTAVGLAISEGKLSLDDEVLKFFPDDAPAQPSTNLKAMRVRDLLRMATGHQTEPQLRPAGPAADNESWTKKFLAHPVAFKPGTHFLYNSPATYMLSAIVQKVTGQTVLEYLRPRLFEPLGINNPTWEMSPQGISTGAYGLMVRTEDIARFGQLYLQKGMWKGRQLIPAAWVEEATARQTSNGSSPKSDWDQGYGYQFWRCRHNAFRGDGAFGQYCIVIPELDAVVAITSGVRDMQAVMNLVWEKLLPAMKSAPLPADAAAERKLKERLASLSVHVPTGQPTTALAAKVSGRWYEFPENDRGVRAVALDFKSKLPALIVRTTSGETRMPIATGAWAKSRDGYTNGLNQLLSVPARPLLAASGAWTADDLFTVKLVAYETPFYSTMKFRFDGDRLVFDAEHNVTFGPTKLPQLIGQAATTQ
jgi:CubicO group peptidase (beta-lactamase class C family)